MNKQEAIEKIKHTDTLTIVDYTERREIAMVNKNEVLDIISQIDEPQKVVVPKFVAEWIEEARAEEYSLYGAWEMVKEGSEIFWWLFDGNESNQDTFNRAWLDGYEIEQEKLYTVEIPNPNGSGYSKIYLARNKDGKVELFTWSCYTSIEFANDWKQEDNAQLTESEIKQDFEWAWDAGFAEEVEEN